MPEPGRVKRLVAKIGNVSSRRAKAPSRETVAWLAKPVFDGGEAVADFSAYCKENREGTPEDKTRGFFDRVQSQLKAGAPLRINLNEEIQPPNQVIGCAETRGQVIAIHVSRRVELTLENLAVGAMGISAGEVARFELKECDVSHVSINRVQAEIVTAETNIGTLQIFGKSLSHFEMAGGCLLDIRCPPPGADNPFTGTVSFSPSVFFSRDRRQYLLKGPQPYRNLRYHLRSLENAQMANFIHSAELAVERDDDTWPNRAISRLYELFSDFGSSALRPLVWLATLAAISFVWAYVADGPALTLERDRYIAWQTIFLRTDWAGDVFKASYLALQPIANPLGIFGKTPLLIAKSPWLALWLSFQGFVSVVLIALTIFAIRRRFKISA